MKGFEVIVDEESISFLSPKCYMCDKFWEYEVYADGVESPLYLCREHLEHCKTKWVRKITKVIYRPPCPNCGEKRLVPHRNAGKRQWKEYPDLLVCEVCWTKWALRDGKLVRVKSKKKVRYGKKG